MRKRYKHRDSFNLVRKMKTLWSTPRNRNEGNFAWWLKVERKAAQVCIGINQKHATDRLSKPSTRRQWIGLNL